MRFLFIYFFPYQNVSVPFPRQGISCANVVLSVEYVGKRKIKFLQIQQGLNGLSSWVFFWFFLFFFCFVFVFVFLKELVFLCNNLKESAVFSFFKKEYALEPCSVL